MSKMSQLHAELSQQAAELGFESIQDAEDHGYEVICDGKGFGRLVKSEDELDQSHEAWLKERDEVIKELNAILNTACDQSLTDYELLHAINYKIKAVEHAINFIRNECHD